MDSFDNRIELAKTLFAGAGAELGVAAGDFAGEYWRVAERLSRHGERSRVRRCTFSEAVAMIPDGSLDWCDVDGYAHTGQDAGQTLEEWWAKLRSGGILAGHDYHPDRPETVAAVEAFVDRHGLEMGFSNEYAKERGEWPSGWVRKP